MQLFSTLISRSAISKSMLACLILFIAACGGGGGGGAGGNSGSDIGTLDAGEGNSNARMLAYTEDIEPILQAKCTGCHNSGDNPLAPFSLEGEERVKAFKSAIHYTVENQTMPPAGMAQLTHSEHAKLMAWLTNSPYNAASEILRIALIEALAWDIQPKNRDAFPGHRPDEVECPRNAGWLVEEDELEVRTEFCNYLSLTQQALLDLESGTELQLALSHSALNFNAPSTAHLAVSIGGTPIWESTIDIPSDSNLIKESLQLPFAVNLGDDIEVHLHNHGSNAWTIHSLDALVPGDQELTFCPSYESTFEAIQATVFEQAGCTNSLCHGETKAGGLDLNVADAWANLVEAPSEGSSLSLVEPRKPTQSYLYHKLSAKTFPGSYDIDGSPMPSAGGAVSPGQLEAIRLWIEAGAPKEGSVGDTLGRGEDEIERLLGVCLPEAEAVNTTPLQPPAPDKGIQFSMPEHEVLAEDERELCFAVYEDFRDVIPPEFLDPSGDFFYVKSGKVREDAFTHHNLMYQPPVGLDQIHDPAFGEWTCAGGDQQGELCEPTDLNSCGTGKCRSQIEDSIACRGYGPTGRGAQGGVLGLGSGPDREGFYGLHPSHGIFYWNSHAFNLTTEDGRLRVWRNLYFAEDRRFRAQGINDLTHIIAATGTPPFGKKTVCRDYVFAQGEALLRLSSHTHKRGERFFMTVGDEQVYETFTYDEPLNKRFEPPLVFNSADPAERTLTYCATWNNGENADGSPNIETVTRLSRRPANASACPPRACVAGNIGGSCAGKDDNASCDSSPGAGDGWCDACIIMPGASSDDEMFILLGTKVADYDTLVAAQLLPTADVAIVSPSEDAVFTAGDSVPLEFNFDNFDLQPPEGHSDEHNHDNAMDHDSEHDDSSSDHGDVTSGHYHIYLDTDDDSADHITAWTETNELVLPVDTAPGVHVIRISLRAPDHHAIDVEASVTIKVQ